MWIEPNASLPENHDVLGPRVGSKDESGAVTEAVVDEELSAIQIHRNFHSWGLVPASHVAKVLSALEPVSLSPQNLRVLQARNKRCPDAQRLHELHEFMTNVDPSQQVGEQRSLKYHVEVHMKYNEQFNRRARDLKLPADWAVDGHYIICACGNPEHIRVKKQQTSEK